MHVYPARSECPQGCPICYTYRRADHDDQSTEDPQQVVANELGDVLAMCLVFAKQLVIDPEVAIAEKWFRHEKVAAASAE